MVVNMSIILWLLADRSRDLSQELTARRAEQIHYMTTIFNPNGPTLISLINVTSRLPILKNSTLHKTKIHPTRLLIS